MNKYLRYLLEIKSYSFALACIVLISACAESEEARIAREEARIAREKAENAARESRVESCVSRNIRACDVDPEFTYCGIVYGDNVIGSGCTSKIRNKPFNERAQFCKEQVEDNVYTMCLIQEYGCKAITGDLNCDK